MSLYIKRLLEKQILAHIDGDQPPFNTLLLNGARQCGKSTLLKALFPPEMHLHINLSEESGFCAALDQTETLEDLELLLASRFHFTLGSGRVLIFDEAQLSKRLGHYVRFFKEIWQTQHVILTGSTLSTLFDNNEKPTGRIREFILRPFNFIEFLHGIRHDLLAEKVQSWSIDRPFSDSIHREILMHLTTYLNIGGLPEVVSAYREKRDWLSVLADIFAFYKRDFTDYVGDRNLDNLFAHIFLRIAVSAGSPITFSSIIKSSSPGYRKLKDIIGILESWHQLISITSETSTLSKIGTLAPKRYIFDHGIRFFQNPARFQDLDLIDATHVRREELGGVIESFVLTELLSLHNPISPRAWSKTNQSGHIDFIWSREKTTTAIEVKSALAFNQKHLSSLLSYKHAFPNSHLLLVNLNRGERISHAELGDISMIPAYAVYAYLRE